MGNGGKQVIWTRCTPKPANADDARLLRDQVYTCLHGGQLMLMLRGLYTGPGLHGRQLMLMMRVSAGPGVHGGQLMLMMRGLCRNWRGQRQADADDVWPLRDQVYTETG